MIGRLILGLILAGAVLAGQEPPPAPPRPMLAPLPPLPPLPPMPELELLDDAFDRGLLAMELASEQAELAAMRLGTAPMLADARGALDRARHSLFLLQAPPAPPAVPTPPVPPQPPRKIGREQDQYRRGQRALDAREWERAIEAFSEVVDRGSQRVDGALYWRAYAQHKAGRRDEALASLAKLQKEHASSAWLNDARALEAEVRRASGQPLSPEQETDEDLKLLALNSLVHSDPERSLPILEKLIQSAGSPKLKERALFVLAQSRTPRAMELLSQVAKGGANPDLQLKAVEYLGIFGGKENRQVLGEIYSSTKSTDVKRRVLQSYMVSKDKERLLAAARSESSPELRGEASHFLGAMGAKDELWQLYQSEQAPEVRERMLQGLFVSKSADKLLEVARTEKDPKLRRTAIQLLGATRQTEAGEALVTMYGSEQDKGVRREILQALFVQQNVKGLIDVARKESDLELKREAVRWLSSMKSKEAADYLIELLK